MKNIIIGFAITATTFAACNNDNSNKENNKLDKENKDTAVASQTPPSNHNMPTLPAQGNAAAEFSTKEIITGYLQLKNALAKDNGKDAAAAGNAIVTTLAKVNTVSLSADKQKEYTELQDDIKEHAEHIGTNASKIDHQREHFVMLSKDVVDLINGFGNSGQPLYEDFCPMANDGKGAIWISEVKEIKNPYLGSKMPDCGTIKETIK